MLGHFLQVSGREEGVCCLFVFFFQSVPKRALGYFLPQQLFNSPLVKHLSVYFAENGISPEAL